MQLFWILLVLLIPPQSLAASFDCAKASTILEKLICSDKELNALDDALGKAYWNTLDKATDRDALKSDQRAWLRSTLRPCGTDKACLMPAYKKRIAALAEWQEAVSFDIELYGTYTQQHPVVSGGAAHDVKDCLTIKPEQGNRVRFSLHIEGDNIHTCALEGVALANDTNLEFRRTAQLNLDAPDNCVLRFIITGNSITLEDADGNCRAAYCGVRAGFNDVAFSREKVGGTCGGEGLR